MRFCGVALLAAQSASAGVAFAGDYITPSHFEDFVAFLRFAVADEVCHNIPINYDGTVSQLMDLAMILAPDDTPNSVANLIAVNEAALEIDARDDPHAFCSSARQLFYSYDPVHLRTVGVID